MSPAADPSAVRYVVTSAATHAAMRRCARMTVSTIIEHVAFEMDRSEDEIRGPSRSPRLTHPRFAVAWLARRHTNKSLRQIGFVLGRRDHTTVRHQVQRAQELRLVDEDFRWMTDRLDSLLASA